MASKFIKIDFTFKTLCLGKSAKPKTLLLINIPDGIDFTGLKVMNLFNGVTLYCLNTNLEDNKSDLVQCLIIFKIREYSIYI